MPRVTIFPAYSLPRLELAEGQAERYFSFDVPERVTANRLKAMVGHDRTSWLVIRLARHEPAKGCPCWGCYAAKRGWLKRVPGWPDPLAGFHRWIRFDIGPKNSQLQPQEGAYFVAVAAVDAREWLGSIADRLGRFGALMALPGLWELAKQPTQDREAEWID